MAVLDIVSIEKEIQTILETQNQINGTPISLSRNLSQDVKHVFRFNPEMFGIQATLIPAVTVWAESKDIETDSISHSQIEGFRKGTLEFSVAGIVFNTMPEPFDEDPAKDDLLFLMENIEEILRNNPQLNGKVKWQVPTGVKYADVVTAEEVAYRVGIMTLNVITRY